MRAHRLWPLCIVALLCACGGGSGDEAKRRTDAAEAGLPKPGQPGGSVTGMPDTPGPGDVPIAGAPPPPPPEMLPGEAFGLPPLEDNPETGMAGDDADGTTDAEPGVDAAIAVVRDYYAAISARDFARAYGLWSDGGRSSGQTPEQFAGGFADTASIEVQPGEPGDVEGAAGSRYVEIPVSVSATRRDGSVHRYIGSYVLRRAVVDGASAEQRAWRIGSAELREIRP